MACLSRTQTGDGDETVATQLASLTRRLEPQRCAYGARARRPTRERAPECEPARPNALMRGHVRRAIANGRIKACLGNQRPIPLLTSSGLSRGRRGAAPCASALRPRPARKQGKSKWLS
eukprot:6198897-Pleurochrysis_carterae.AAC.1